MRAAPGFARSLTSRAWKFFDAALVAESPNVLAADFDRARLRGLATAGVLPPILSGLVKGMGGRRISSPKALAAKLAALPEGEREAHLAELVRAEVAAVLGHPSSAAVDHDLAFKEMGFDSLAAVKLRNRLSSLTGLALPSTLAFDCPSAAAVTDFLLSRLTDQGAPGAAELSDAEVSAVLGRLEEMLASSEPSDQAREGIRTRLQALLAGIAAPGPDGPESAADGFSSMSNEEMLALIDDEFGQA